ncbi:MAG TPA: tRNA (adenosine(37)-N6)-threonylcarbamoyltransferase complex transferase subunit TsaD [Bacteroidota bacterium]|nr:tRNA (adenosine(37)-N6)-threonylcarbamoyltransferase complex transferase subunit TsaD [Bacteroidota bacterium]
MRVLGIETSCDETSAAVVDDGIVRSNVISSQLVHAKYGGVVPELASRAHQRLIVQVVDEALERAGTRRDEIDAVAATYGPGLAGALLVGLSFAKGLSVNIGTPFLGVNHMEGHLYSNFLGSRKPEYPFLSLIVSGGHTMLVAVRAPFDHVLLGQTRDDAAGEAFDKVAKMLGLGYPGGPIIDRLAVQGNPAAISFPRSFLEPGSFDFSFSGVKTAVLYYLRDRGMDAGGKAVDRLGQEAVNDICASFQQSVLDVLVTKTMRAAEKFGVKAVTVAGGVSANAGLRAQLSKEAEARGIPCFQPALEYCMDNGAMIAYVGWLKASRGHSSNYRLNADPNLELT